MLLELKGGYVVSGQDQPPQCRFDKEWGHYPQAPELRDSKASPPMGSPKPGSRPAATPGVGPLLPAGKSRGLLYHQHICLLEPSSPILFLLPLAALWKLKGYLQ